MAYKPKRGDVLPGGVVYGASDTDAESIRLANELDPIIQEYNKLKDDLEWFVKVDKSGKNYKPVLINNYTRNEQRITESLISKFKNEVQKLRAEKRNNHIARSKMLRYSDNEGGLEHSMDYDFGGYATRANLKCSDGRIIDKDAFFHCDGIKVPLVWQHLRDDPGNVLGYTMLEHRDDGIYAYGKFNSTEKAQTAKELVKHGDINALSIYANHLSQRGPTVTHGDIREVSLVIAGANPGAFIDNVSITHSDGSEEELSDEAIIYVGEELDHSDIYNKTDDDLEHADDSSDESKAKTVKEVFDSLNDDQKTLFYAMVGQALEEGDDEDDDVEQSDYNEGGNDMKWNAFEGKDNGSNTLSHDDIASIFSETNEVVSQYGSFKKALKATALEHGITDIDSLFPDYKVLNNPPDWVGTPEAWVTTVWNGTRKTPFSRIKSVFADITKDEARARGYIKGKQKLEEQFSLLKRTTDPQTVYKKQSLDRDDIIDITDFDVVAWLKSEMRMKLQEELSRAILIGDGRLSSDESKIQETHIRSILNDDDFYSVKYQVDMSGLTDSTDKANAIIDGTVLAMIDYKGSGSLTAFMSPQTLATLRVAKDKNGRRLYNSTSEIASALGVSNIVDVPLMKDQTRVVGDKTYKTLGILVNLRDYTIGADRGGQTTMFDDFDIDYNKYKYLIETRCSGALIRPASAIVLETENVAG